VRRQSASGDGAFARTREPRAFENHCPHESGVALRFPPQSMTPRAMATCRRCSPCPAGFGGRSARGATDAEKRSEHRRLLPVGALPLGRDTCVIIGQIESPSGKTAQVQTIWIVDKGLTVARLVTAYPRKM